MIKFLTILLLFPATAIACNSSSKVYKTSDFQVETLIYSSPDSRKHLIIVPPTGGTNFLDRNWAENFCEEGFTAHILEHWTNDSEIAFDLDVHQRFYNGAQKAIATLLENITDEVYVGIFGTSIGGIHTAMAMGLHDRLDAAFVITAGANMPAMIANSDQDLMIKAWERRKKELGIPDKASYIKLLSEKIDYEPLKLPRKFEGKDLGMIISTSDTTVPYKNQLALKNHWKPKKVIKYSFDHFWTIVLSWLWDSEEVIEFFKKSSEGKKHA